MPLPKWLARVNKRLFNPMELKRGVRPVLTHTGRTSGTTHRTPLDAHPVDGGFIFIAAYGSDSDWVKNVMAAGSARLTTGGDTFELTAPLLLSTEEARRQLPDGTKTPADFLGVAYLRMEHA